MTVLAMEDIVDHGKTHRTDTGQKSHLAILLDVHGVDIAARSCVVVGMDGADYAGKRLAQRCRIECLTVVWEKAALLHHLVRDDDIGGVATDVAV